MTHFAQQVLKCGYKSGLTNKLRIRLLDRRTNVSKERRRGPVAEARAQALHRLSRLAPFRFLSPVCRGLGALFWYGEKGRWQIPEPSTRKICRPRVSTGMGATRKILGRMAPGD